MKSSFIDSWKIFCAYIFVLWHLLIIPIKAMEIESSNDFLGITFKQVIKDDYEFALNFKELEGQNKTKKNIPFNLYRIKHFQEFIKQEKNKLSHENIAKVRNFYYAFFNVVEIVKIKNFLLKECQINAFKDIRTLTLELFSNNCLYINENEKKTFLEKFYQNPFTNNNLQEKLSFYYSNKNESIKKCKRNILIDKSAMQEITNFITTRVQALKNIYQKIFATNNYSMQSKTSSAEENIYYFEDDDELHASNNTSFDKLRHPDDTLSLNEGGNSENSENSLNNDNMLFYNNNNNVIEIENKFLPQKIYINSPQTSHNLQQYLEALKKDPWDTVID